MMKVMSKLSFDQVITFYLQTNHKARYTQFCTVSINTIRTILI